ncbi:ATP-binding protein [Micromonospora nigra]|uniref:ATP-binding protein n=1 Tax=Micromonospora nigra TaxID=145857 RepID=UPI000A5B5740|nr:ATP-binding protein [Micromonospora nigra]
MSSARWGLLPCRKVALSYATRSCRSRNSWRWPVRAILDRLLHHRDVVAINGPSYRLKNRLTAIDGQANVA